MGRKIDDTDYKILRILQERGRITNKQLASEIGLSPAPTLERVRKLEEEYINSYHASIDHGKLGLTIQAFIQVSLERQRENAIQKFVEKIGEVEEIVECHQVIGDFDYLLKVMTTDIRSFDKLITETLSTIEEIGHMKSYVILSTLKDTKVAPIHLE